jgi:hypothetical protein
LVRHGILQLLDRNLSENHFIFKQEQPWFVASEEREEGFTKLLHEKSFKPGLGMTRRPAEKWGIDTGGETKPPRMRRPVEFHPAVPGRAPGLHGAIVS